MQSSPSPQSSQSHKEFASVRIAQKIVVSGESRGDMRDILLIDNHVLDYVFVVNKILDGQNERNIPEFRSVSGGRLEMQRVHDDCHDESHKVLENCHQIFFRLKNVCSSFFSPPKAIKCIEDCSSVFSMRAWVTLNI